MGKRYVLGLIVIASLSIPRASSAVDWIWELSGPMMFGPDVYCKIQFDGGTLCDEYGGLGVWQENQVTELVWVRAKSAILFSVKNNPTDSTIYAAFFEGTFEGRWTPMRWRNFMLYWGAGYSYNYFFGSAFENYVNPAWKLTPVGLQWATGWKDWIVKSSFAVRWFDKTFNTADVSNPLPGSEAVYGMTIDFARSFSW